MLNNDIGPARPQAPDPHSFVSPPGPRPAPSAQPDGFAATARRFGVEPFGAGAVVLTDAMMQNVEIVSFGLFCAISAAIGLFVIAPCCVLLQRFSYKDPWPSAVAKGCLLGLVTALPTALPSFVTIGLGVAGYIGRKHSSAN